MLLLWEPQWGTDHPKLIVKFLKQCATHLWRDDVLLDVFQGLEHDGIKGDGAKRPRTLLRCAVEVRLELKCVICARHQLQVPQSQS